MHQPIEWLSVDAIIYIHAEQIAEHGGAPGLADRGALESALARPRQIESYQPDPGIHRLAAAYAFGLTRNHPFVDGNKRIAFLAAFALLYMNGRFLDVAEKEATERMLALSSGELSESEFSLWLSQNSVDVEL